MSPSQNFMSAGHRDVVARILDVLGSSASAVLTAPAGAGKTAVLNAAASECAKRSWRLIKVAGSASEPLGVRAFAVQLARLPEAGGLADNHVGQALEALTTADAGRARTLLVVDGAETSSSDTLLVIQLACEMQPLLQVLFAGRPEFGNCLAHPELARLRGRLAPPFSLPPLSEREAAALIAHRMHAAGLDSRMPAASAILRALISHGAGNPGRIGAVLDRALADPQRHAAVPSPIKSGDERGGAGDGTAQAGFRQPTPCRADQAAAIPMRSARRRSGFAVPAAAAVALLGVIGLGAVAFRTPFSPHHTPLATAEGRPTPAQPASPSNAPPSLAAAPDQAAAMPAGTAPASGAGDAADVAPASPHSPDGNWAAPAVLEERATVVVMPGSARSASAAATAIGDAAPTATTGPPALLPGPGGAMRLANAARSPAIAVPPFPDAGRFGRLTALSTFAPDDRRCRDILRRMQLGEDPTDVEKGLLRTGCRRDR